MLHDVNQQVVNSVTSAGRTSGRGVQIEIARAVEGGVVTVMTSHALKNA